MLNLIVIEIRENTIAPDLIFEQSSFILKRRIFDTITGNDFSNQYNIEEKRVVRIRKKRITFSILFNSKTYKYTSISIEMSYFL